MIVRPSQVRFQSTWEGTHEVRVESPTRNRVRALRGDGCEPELSAETAGFPQSR